jgi:hypothetical protein
MGQPELAAPPQAANLTGAKFQEAHLDGAQLQNAMPAICQQVVSSDPARCLAPHHRASSCKLPEQG